MKSDWFSTIKVANRRREEDGQGNSMAVLIAGPVLSILVSTSLLVFLVLLFSHGLSASHHALLQDADWQAAPQEVEPASHILRI